MRVTRHNPGERRLGGIFHTDKTGASFVIEIDPDGFDGLVLQRDPSAALWVAESLWPSGDRSTVEALIPSMFDAYARVNYPPSTLRETQSHARLFELLARYTETPSDAWFCLWDGYGGIARVEAGVLLEVPFGASRGRVMRTYLVYQGPLSAWDAMSPWPLHHVPDLAWPDDRAWFVGTDTDLEWGYVGGSEACIAALEGDAKLEVTRVSPRDPLGWFGRL